MGVRRNRYDVTEALQAGANAWKVEGIMTDRHISNRLKVKAMKSYDADTPENCKSKEGIYK